MSLLSADDSFRPRRFDASPSINALLIPIEDSIYQYSQAQTQRRTQAQQWIESKEAKDDGNDNNKIEATISEDLADGQTGKLDAALKLLSDDELRLLIPSDELEDDEIHIIETQFGAPQGGNHSLQDYQMQLMLLEQQNKKRLLLARQAQDNQGYDNNRTQIARRVHEERFSDRMKTSKVTKSDHLSPIMPQTRSVTRPRTAVGKRKLDDESQEQQPNKSARDIYSSDSNAIQGLNTDRRDLSEDIPPHVDLIYKISCTHGIAGNHPVPAFRDAPVPNAPWDAPVPNAPWDTLAPSASWDTKHHVAHNSRSHLNGTVPIFDLEAFMDDETDDIAFVVIRTVECSEASILMARAGVPLRWTEDVYAKSRVSKDVLQQITTCHFQPAPKPERDPYSYSPPSPPASPFDHNRITPLELFLFHHRQLLENYVAQYPETKEHMDGLLQYMDNRCHKDFEEAENLFARGLVTQTHILKLFCPNKLVVSGICGRPAAFVVQDWPALSSSGWLTITCWSFQTEGSRFSRKQTILSIPPLEPEVKEIQSLPAYPYQFAALGVRKSIRAHGEKQWELRMTTQITYRGWNVKRDQYYPDARFMIDHGIYRKMHEFAVAFKFDKPSTTHSHDRMPAYLTVEETPSETSLLLLSPVIHGFYLNEKKWVQLFVDCIHPVSWNKKAYERLVLPDQTKDLVQALVSVRTSQRGVKQGIGLAGKRTDITGGKGNGLIMLLHGGPGTGKTLTAESVAEIAEMPLYRVTCGDIGTNAEAVEKYLNTVLHLGKIWNCVLLLDEADVFLEERSMADLKRNSLVSVFLRILEYYDGILILSSNRVGMFDEAFKSRIQVALHYENLNRSSRRKIWQNFIDMLEEDEEDVNFDEIKLHLDDLAAKDLNGRQIRNVLTTARQLAIFRNERLEWEHLAQALSVSSDFSAYLKRMQGHTDDQRARDEHWR